MITIRSANDRGHTDIGWLDSHHTFSFGEYHDPAAMGFRALRVINEDKVRPGQGFGTHSHRDMEIISYVLGGALQHKDSIGTGSVIRPGDVQRMSAGTGVSHSEFNASKTEPVHFLQIWIVPEKRGIAPSYEERNFSPEERKNTLRLVAAHDARDGAIAIHQDVALYASLLESGKSVDYAVPKGRHAWVQVARGGVTVNGKSLGAGDGAAISDEVALHITATEDAELLLFDLN